jgi:hypothetical protein
MLTKITDSTGIAPEGKAPARVLAEVARSLNETIVLLSRVNNEVVDLAMRVQELESSPRLR